MTAVLLANGTLWVALIVLVMTTNLLLHAFHTRRRFPRLRLPPTPSGAWPILGHIPLLSNQPHQALMNMGKKYGPLMHLRLGYVPAVVVSSPEILREMFQVNDVIMASRPRMIATDILGYNTQDIVGAPYGEHWRKMRRFFVQELLNQKRLLNFQVVRKSEVLNTVQSIFDRAKTSTDVRVDLKSELRDLTLNNITQMMLGKTCFGPKSDSSILSQEFARCANEITHIAAVFSIGEFVPFLDRFDVLGVKAKLLAARERFDQILDNIILEHRTGDSHKPDRLSDFVDVLLQHQQKEGLSDEVVKGAIFNILLGGTDTSSTLLEWLMAELVRSPSKMLRAQKELDEVVGRDRMVEESDIPKLKYLQACVKEVLRKRPVFPLMIPHESSTSCTVGGYDIPAKTRVIVNMWAIHMDPAYWENPEEFRPERFLEANIDVRGQNFSYVPFGTGRRICLGLNLGMLMVQYVAAVLLQTYDWSLPNGQQLEDMDMLEEFGLALSKKVPLCLVPTIRLPDHVYDFENTEK